MQKKIGPWTQETSQLVYENSWIKLRHDNVTTPGGHKGVYGVVEFQNRALAVIPISSDDKIVLVGQHRYPLDNYSWEIPAGGGSLDEDKSGAIQRELKEETGFTAKSWTILASNLELSNSVSNEQGWIWIAEDLIPGLSNPESCEELKLKEVTFAEAFLMIKNGQIRDMLSVLGIYMANEYLNQL
jgi:8-oxo-dGTP pyrophosphatase MutT (NUDIX family)